MPPQAIALRACGQAVFGALVPALMPLDDMVNFPIAGKIFRPSAFLDLDRIATEVTMPIRLLEYSSELICAHGVKPYGAPTFTPIAGI